MAMLLKAVCRTAPLLAGSLAAILLFAGSLCAQAPALRLSEKIDNSQRVVLPGSHPPMARPESDAGRMPSGTPLQGVGIVFSRSPGQEAELQTLLSAQQDPASPLYHKWLTADQFAARFGVADGDIAKVESWLEQQGFAIDGASRSKDRVTFSGTSDQVEAAFSTELHYYNTNGKKHFAPATDLSLPVALSPLVQTVTNLSTFRPKPHLKISAPRRAPSADFTSSQTGEHFLTPGDIATIYDIKAAYNAGYTGSGKSIAAVGQSEIVLSDIENFQKAAGLPVRDPTVLLVPHSGTSAISTGDESESDIDLEYSGAIAKGATIYFVYVGNSPNYSVFDSLNYAIENQTAAVITISYGDCESDLGAGEYASLNAKLAQAAAQGQTVATADGDSGSTDCYGNTDQTTAEQQALAVDFPSSSQYVTAMGGTEFSAADVAVGNNTFWAAQSSADIISSALSYIPEQVWNDDSASGGLSAGGGGVSSFTSRPSWQANVPGIPAGAFRLVPDLSLTASPNNAGFLYCSSDSSLDINGSCSNGFRDANNQYLTVAGGTSFDAPIFAGMVAIINEKLNSSGQGVVSAILYTLAQNAGTYASAFHDITSGSNECTAGPTYCSAAGESEYPATTGYDQASGLGSVDFNNLLSSWPGSNSSPLVTTTTLSAATTTPAPGSNDAITITVTSASGTPSGTLAISVDGVTQTSSLALSGGSAVFTFDSTATGSHTVTATYSGDANYSSSTGSVTLTVSSSQKTFTLKATSPTVTAGNSVSSTVTVTPENGYTGTITWTVSSSPAISNACFVLPNTTVSGSSAVMASLTIYTSSSACAAAAATDAPGGKRKLGGVAPTAFEENLPALPPALRLAGTSWAFAGLFLVLLLRLKSQSRGAWSLGVLLLAVLGAALSGCSNAGSASSPTTPTGSEAPTGTYTLTIVGKDSTSASISASTTATLNID
ncbi:MAG: protease pro-enzyme activation domain-containing protein [Candidatus Acidiferrum sp.]